MMSSVRWLPKNALQPFAWGAVFGLCFDCLVWAVLHRFSFLTAVRMISSVAFLWLYRQRSPFAWHVTFIGLILIQLCYAVGESLHIITPPHVPSGPYAIFYPYVVGLIVLSYLWFVRNRYFSFIRHDI